MRTKNVKHRIIVAANMVAMKTMDFYSITDNTQLCVSTVGCCIIVNPFS
jgi:hypothetical protein